MTGKADRGASSVLIGVVSEDSDLTDRITALVTERDGEVRTGSARSVLAVEPDSIVTIGEEALLSLVRVAFDRNPTNAQFDAPVLPIAAGRGVPSVARSDLDRAVDGLLSGRLTRSKRTLLSVSMGDDDVARAIMDATLVSTEPARISEFGLSTRGNPVDRFRADGIVVATPMGSYGYARDAGGPLLAKDSRVLAVVPIAPFVTDADRWVLRDEEIELTVERDEVAVTLFVDGHDLGKVSPHSPVRLVRAGTIDLLSPPDATQTF